MKKTIRELIEKEIQYPIEDWIERNFLKKNFDLWSFGQLHKKFASTLERDDFYQIFRKAYLDVRDRSHGEVNFRYNPWLSSWEYFRGADDATKLLWFHDRNILGKMKTYIDDFNLNKEMYPEIKEDVKILEMPKPGFVDIKRIPGIQAKDKQKL